MGPFALSCRAARLLGFDCEAALLLVAVGDTTTSEVVGSELYLNLVSGKDADVVHPHFSGDVRQHLVAIFEFDTEHCVRQRFDNGAFQHDGVFFRLRQRGLLISGGQIGRTSPRVRAEPNGPRCNAIARETERKASARSSRREIDYPST